ncbi:unnamed protein product [Cyprideis torosa]|uniref:Calponin-homology (CH) domain-containing protein n=1 Tax=Cyprideis torosa TaxID=163714 RepID=A0A7R8W8I8_9CRUS|nr:unnamed protein product [Cyprideis torosa]CAG0884350.1 unnamed protein product [Cyprideis torosa]
MVLERLIARNSLRGEAPEKHSRGMGGHRQIPPASDQDASRVTLYCGLSGFGMARITDLGDSVMRMEPRPFRPFKTSEEYLVAMVEDLAEWLNNLYNLRLDMECFFDRLEDGVALCKKRFELSQAVQLEDRDRGSGHAILSHVPELLSPETTSRVGPSELLSPETTSRVGPSELLSPETTSRVGPSELLLPETTARLGLQNSSCLKQHLELGLQNSSRLKQHLELGLRNSSCLKQHLELGLQNSSRLKHQLELGLQNSSRLKQHLELGLRNSSRLKQNCQHANNVRQTAHKFRLRNPHKTRLFSSYDIPETEVKFREGAAPGTFFARDNIHNFISWCRALGIYECLLFETDDLVMRKNIKSVVLCLLEVARRGAKYGMEAPLLVQMEREIDRDIAKDRGESVSSGVSEDEADGEEEDNGHWGPTGDVEFGPHPQLITNDLKSLDELQQKQDCHISVRQTAVLGLPEVRNEARILLRLATKDLQRCRISQLIRRSVARLFLPLLPSSDAKLLLTERKGRGRQNSKQTTTVDRERAADNACREQ